MEQEIGTWDSVLLENLSEDNFISNLHQRYTRDHIYTYIGTSVVAINPFKPLGIYSPELVRTYGSRGIFQLPPHIYGLANLAYQSLRDQCEDQCIILSGESGSGKTESFRMAVQFLTQIQDIKKSKSQYRRRNSIGSLCVSGSSSRPNSRPSTPKRQSPILYTIHGERPTAFVSYPLKGRSESSDRSTTQRKLSREKVVDFDFSHHKSTDNISQYSSVMTQTITTPKSCFKHNHVDTIGRSKTLTNVDYCFKKSSNCDLSKNLSLNKIQQQEIIYTNLPINPCKINSCCQNLSSSSSSTSAVTVATIGTSSCFQQNPKIQSLHHPHLKQQHQENYRYYDYSSKSLPHQSKSVPTTTSTTNSNCCRLCNHSNCRRQQSFDEVSESQASTNVMHCTGSGINSNNSSSYGFLSKSIHDATAGGGSGNIRGSCANLSRESSTASNNCCNNAQQMYVTPNIITVNMESSSPAMRCSRISLVDAHKLNKKFLENHSLSSSTIGLSTIDNLMDIKAQKLRDRVACSNIFLEAMGNAATLKNANSSRFGKFFDMEIDFKGNPIGVHITHFMLEKTRVTHVNSGERNFHIFYQLLLGADVQFLKLLKLYRNVDKYELLKNTSATDEDKMNFSPTKKSLEIMGLNSDEIISIFKVIAVVLKLGNFIFIPITNIDGTEGCQVSNDYELQETAQLLNLDAQILLNCLTRSSTHWVQDDNGSELDAKQASKLRDTLCRTLYGRLFTWIVNRINDSLKSHQREKNLALLDFYGFECFEMNSFEQLAINYSNEKLHQNFLQSVLKFEQDLYLREGLEWSKIDFFDNETICELIDKPNYGILSLLNEPHINSDESLLLRMQQCCAGHPNFLSNGPTIATMCFKIRHYANVVTYSVTGFLEKNSDNLSKNISAGLYQSKMNLIQSLFPEGNPKRLSKKPTSISCSLRTQLQTLLSIIKNRRNHYVFCIKPNDTRQPRTFELALVQHQVRYMSLMPLVNLCRTGHCFHITHTKFFNRYKLLNTLTWPHFKHGTLIEGIAIIIRNVPLPSAEFTIGTKNVFIRSPRTVYELEDFRKSRLNDLAVLIQKTFRMYRHRKKFVRMRESQIIISSAWRTWRECRFGIPFTGRRHLWSLYRVAREEYRAMKYKKQVDWAVQVIYKYYRKWKTVHFLLTLPLRLPPNSMSPLSLEWPSAPKFLTETSRLLRNIYHRWRCYVYRKSFDQISRNRMREKVTASILFKDRKASYPRSVAHPFIGDYVRLRHNLQWKKYSVETNDQYVVFADIINKIARSSGKFVPILLVLSTSSMLLLDQRTLQVKYRVPATEIYRLSLSPYLDDVAVFHVKADHYCTRDHDCNNESPTGCLFQSEMGLKKGDFVFQTGHVIEIVTKLFLVIQNATSKPPEVHISTEFEANFGHQTVVFTFKYGGMSELLPGQLPKVTRRANRMEIVV